MPLRLIAGRILRELIGLLMLSMMPLSGVAVAQEVPVSLDESLRSGSLPEPADSVFAAGRRSGCPSSPSRTWPSRAPRSWGQRLHRCVCRRSDPRQHRVRRLRRRLRVR